MQENHETPGGIEMPRPTAAPFILSAGLALAAAGVALSWALSIVGAIVFVAGLIAWIGHLLPGRGHHHEPQVPAEGRPSPPTATPGAVEQLQAGMPGYRLRLPVKIHPISAGIKGGIIGGLVMPLPAIAWGILSGHGIWYPLNLLAGMVLHGLDSEPTAELERFHWSFFIIGLVIHGAMSLVLGLIYGVLLPTLPPLGGRSPNRGEIGQLFWGGLLLPLMWTGASYALMGVVNPLLQAKVDWPSFIGSQFVFGVTAAMVVIRTEKIPVPPKGTGPDTAPLTS